MDGKNSEVFSAILRNTTQGRYAPGLCAEYFCVKNQGQLKSWPWLDGICVTGSHTRSLV